MYKTYIALSALAVATVFFFIPSPASAMMVTDTAQVSTLAWNNSDVNYEQVRSGRHHHGGWRGGYSSYRPYSYYSYGNSPYRYSWSSPYYSYYSPYSYGYSYSPYSYYSYGW